MSLTYILVLSTILYVSWRFGQAWISKRERSKRSDTVHGSNT